LIETVSKPIDFTIVRHDLGVRLTMAHARWLRGAVIQRANRPEFHQHDADGVIHQQPLIRYDVSTGLAELAGIAEGALLLRALPPFDAFALGRETLRVSRRDVESGRVELGPTAEPIRYLFLTPYLGLNQENHRQWERVAGQERQRLLERVVIGNMLSLSKSIGLHVSERLRAEVDLHPCGLQTLKPGVELLGFAGSIRINFRLPVRWGIGKSSARGFGTLTAQEN
jgi:Cas6b C-terminal domain/Cas6b N-terminal domain